MNGRNIICKRTIDLAKEVFGDKGKRDRNIKANVEIELYTHEDGNESLAITGDIITPTIASCGQCEDEIDGVEEIRNNPLWKRVKALWKNYHLNDLHAGTKRQEDALEAKNLRRADDYDKACEYLKSIGLYEDNLAENESVDGDTENPAKRKAYAYGTAWLTHRLPKAVIDEVKELCAA